MSNEWLHKYGLRWAATAPLYHLTGILCCARFKWGKNSELKRTTEIREGMAINDM